MEWIMVTIGDLIIGQWRKRNTVYEFNICDDLGDMRYPFTVDTVEQGLKYLRDRSKING